MKENEEIPEPFPIYIQEKDEYIEAIGFKNDKGMWDIFLRMIQRKRATQRILYFLP